MYKTWKRFVRASAINLVARMERRERLLVGPAGPSARWSRVAADPKALTLPKRRNHGKQNYNGDETECGGFTRPRATEGNTRSGITQNSSQRFGDAIRKYEHQKATVTLLDFTTVLPVMDKSWKGFWC